MVRKRCFVISPIGLEGSPERKHADNVFKYIIQPAVEKFGVEVFRSDHVLQSGKISDQMFRALLNEDFCIAVLTDHNPNVFYELAIAQAAARPVIIMLKKGQELPFDIKDLRCVYYDFDPEPLVEGEYVAQLVGHVKALAESNWKAPSIFGDLSPLGAKPVGQMEYQFHEKSDNFGSPDVWLRLLLETQKSFNIMGISLGSWKRGKGFTEALLSKAAGGCLIRVLLAHKDNPCLPYLINDNIPEVDLAGTVQEVEAMHQFFSRLASRNPNIQVRRIARGCPHFQMTQADSCALYIQYLFSQKTGWSPLWQTLSDTPLYKVLAEEFELLWQLNEEKSSPPTVSGVTR